MTSSLDYTLPEAALAGPVETAGLLQSKERLTAAVLHDLGSPLSSILLYCDLLLGREADDYAKERLGRIRDAAEKCQRLVGQLAEVVTPATVGAQALAVPELVENALELVRPRLAANGIEVAVTMEPGLPPVYGDRATLTVVLLSVLNALRGLATTGEGAGQIDIRAQSVAPAPGSENFVRLEIVRGGTSTDAGAVDRLNEQAPAVPSLAERNLELWGARAAVQRLGGRLWAERPPANDGATILIELPTQNSA